MTPNRTLRARHLVVAVGALTVVATACDSGRDAAIEELIERQSGEEVDIDFGEDGFSFQTEDSEFSIDIGEDGSFTFDSDEGSGTFSADGDGSGEFTFDGVDGSGEVQFDTNDDGSFTVTDENGDVVVGDVEDDGTFTVTGAEGETTVIDDSGASVTDENGETAFESGTAIPDQWPSDVPEPRGLSDVTGSYVAQGDDAIISALGTIPGDGSGYLEDYSAELQDAGFTETSTYNSAGVGAGFTAERGTTVITANLSNLGDESQVIVGLQIGS